MGLQVDYHAKPRCPLTLQIELSAGNMRMESPIKSLSILAKSVSYRQHAGTGSSRLGPVCHRTIDVRDGEAPLGPTPCFPPPRASAGLFPSVSSSPRREASTPCCSVFPVSLRLSYAGPLPPSYSLFSRLSGPFCVSRLGWFCWL